MAPVKTGSSIQSTLAAVVSHPVRVKCLSILAERTSSPKQMGTELGEETSNVSYHVRELEKLGVVELVDEKKRRGAVEHFYRARTLAYVSDEEWAKLPIAQRSPYSLYILQMAMADVAAAIETTSFDRRDDRYLTRTPGTVDERGWGELHDLHEEMFDRMLEILAGSADRRSKTPEEPGIPIMSIAMFFERATAAPPKL